MSFSEGTTFSPLNGCWTLKALSTPLIKDKHLVIVTKTQGYKLQYLCVFLLVEEPSEKKTRKHNETKHNKTKAKRKRYVAEKIEIK